MAGMFLLIVLLVLILTGTIGPVLIFGGWSLVAVLTIILILSIVASIFGFALRIFLAPFVMIWEDISDWTEGWRKGPKFPRPGDPDYKIYIEWMNNQGDYVRYRDWEDVKSRRKWEREHIAWRKSKSGSLKFD